MDHFDPDTIDADGQRQIASWYRPWIGPYDSADPVVLEYHVVLMRLAGVDGMIVDWYGADDYLDYRINDHRTRAVRDQAYRAGLKFALCYEDLTVKRQVEDGHLEEADAIINAQSSMRYAESNYFRHPGYLRRGGRPLFLNFGPQYFKESSEWETIFSVLDQTNRPAFFTEDRRLAVGEGAFSWPPMWLSLSPGARGVLSSAALRDYLDRFEERGATWPASISSAFPRFHDIYKLVGAREYWGYLRDHGGRTFRQTLTRALTNESAMVQIVTWNDFGEGTMVEPTIEYGFRDLGIIQELRRKHLDPEFSHDTNDLQLAVTLYQLRRAAGTSDVAQESLNRVFEAIVDGQLERARQGLAKIESEISTDARDAEASSK
jgi:hypothetical protein